MRSEEKLLLISPYMQLKHLADEVIADRHLAVETALGELQAGGDIARQAEKMGKEVLISRGGTARVIRDYVELPVVEIQVTGYDILRALLPYKGMGYQLGIVGYSNVISGCKLVCDLLEIQMAYFSIESEEEVLSKLEEAVQQGISCFIGDTVAMNTTRELNLSYGLIESGREAIENALDEALKLHDALQKERREKEQLQAILDFSHEGIVAVNNCGQITLCNASAEKIFGVTSPQVIGKSITTFIPESRIPAVLSSGRKELDQLQQVGKVFFAANRVPIIINDQTVGAVATFQEVTHIQELEQEIRKKLFRKGFVTRHTFSSIIGKSSRIQARITLARKFGKTESTIMIYGESGTGKELFAQSMHNVSERRHGPFVVVNCAALPGNLLESELFGYAEGAFTGARKGGKKGLFELAHKGTIFLDEVGEMDQNVQARILRVIQEKEVMRLGDDKVIPVDVRIIGATNKTLKREVRLKNFRQDLFYRLHVLTLEIPPLRQRSEDIEQLLPFFLQKFCHRHGMASLSVEEGVLQHLQAYPWPGNIREFQNILERLIIMADGIITTRAVEQIFASELQQGNDADSQAEQDFLHGSLDDITGRILRKVLEEESFNKSRAAQRLNIDRGTLNRKLQATKRD